MYGDEWGDEWAATAAGTLVTSLTVEEIHVEAITEAVAPGPIHTVIVPEDIEIEAGVTTTDLQEPPVGTLVLTAELSSPLPGVMTTTLSDASLELESGTITTVVPPIVLEPLELAIITSRLFGTRRSGVTLSNFVQLNAVED